MKRLFTVGTLAALLVAGSAGAAMADVKTEEKSQIKFEGMLGRMFNLFGGKSAKEGLVNIVAVQGNRKATMGDNSGQIVDLDEEKIYEINTKDRSYKVTTFAEMRRQLEEAKRKAEEQQAKAEAREKKEEKAEPGKEVEIDFDVRDTGQKRAVSGFDARQVVMTITVREKGKKLEESGGLVLTSDMWLTPSIPAMKEVMDFDVRYAKAIAGPMAQAMSAEQMAQAMAMYPMMADAMKKMQAESGKLEGTAVLTTTTFDAVANPQQAQQSAEQEEAAPKSMGGLLGGLGRRMAKKSDDKKDEGKAAGPKNRATIMTISHEVLKVSTTVAASDLAIPAGFKLKN
jgi:hypothetical protein